MNEPGPLQAEGVALGYGDRLVVDGLDLRIARGRITALVGPNGSGKSTIIKALVRILSPRAGRIRLDGAPIADASTRAVARRIAVLPQTTRAPEGLTVRELVTIGRFPYRRALRGPGPEDARAIDRALAQVELGPLADRPLDALSGGQAQRAWIAMALAQETGILLLDEPTTYLDIAHQIDLLALLRRLNQREGLTVVMAIHDLNLAARHADRMVALREGRVVAEGPPVEVMRAEIIEAVFGVRVVLARVDGSPIPLFVPDAAPPTEAGPVADRAGRLAGSRESRRDR